MRLSLDLPDPPRLEPLLESLSQQYQQVMQGLLKLQADAQRDDRYAPILQAMQSQQEGLVHAFERLMTMMHQGQQEEQQQLQTVIRDEVAAPQQQASDALLSTLRGMKQTMNKLPENLGTVMTKSFKSKQRELMKPKASESKAPESSRAVVNALGSLEDALVQGLKKSRNRTFGSNY